MSIRFTQEHVDEWRETGFVIIEDFFTKAEIEPIQADFEQMYANRGQGEGVGKEKNLKKPGQIGKAHFSQFQNFDQLPYHGSEAVNLISLHPALIEFSKALLGVDQVHCYQSHTWAKYTGEADYDQQFHCDFGNHTLTVPSDNVADRPVDFIFYIEDVEDDLGALHFVTKQDVAEVLGLGELMPPDEKQLELKAREKSARGPAGTLVAHSIDTMHRGTNLTRPNGRRFTMTVGYRAAQNEMVNFHVWQFAPDRPWEKVLNHAAPEQLQVLGIPLPGNAFWTERTLSLTQARWPDWDMSAYRQAAS